MFVRGSVSSTLTLSTNSWRWKLNPITSTLILYVCFIIIYRRLNSGERCASGTKNVINWWDLSYRSSSSSTITSLRSHRGDGTSASSGSLWRSSRISCINWSCWVIRSQSGIRWPSTASVCRHKSMRLLKIGTSVWISMKYWCYNHEVLWVALTVSRKDQPLSHGPIIWKVGPQEPPMSTPMRQTRDAHHIHLPEDP